VFLKTLEVFTSIGAFMKIQTLFISVFLMSLILTSGCATTGTSNSSNSSSARSDTIEVHDPSLSLADYIRRAGGVSVHNIDGQTRIRIRGNLSFNSTSEPLFVIDGVRSGNNYDRVENIVPLDFIESIQVLKGSDASTRFGLAASSGAIIITTKRR
jgi:TonB-dependent SusC/RagA subfamily outer membrane receptor